VDLQLIHYTFEFPEASFGVLIAVAFCQSWLLLSEAQPRSIPSLYGQKLRLKYNQAHSSLKHDCFSWWTSMRFTEVEEEQVQFRLFSDSNWKKILSSFSLTREYLQSESRGPVQKTCKFVISWLV